MIQVRKLRPREIIQYERNALTKKELTFSKKYFFFSLVNGTVLLGTGAQQQITVGNTV